MKKQISVIIIMTLMMQLLFNIIFPIASIAAVEENITITCQDVNFYNALKTALAEKTPTTADETMTITMPKTKIEEVTTLDLNSLNASREEKIIDISGIENFTKLTSLNLSYNQISDISKLASLTELTQLSLADNQIADITVLENFEGLTSLSLSYNGLSNIATIGQLTNLQSLMLTGNQISDITPLKTLTELKDLSLSGNQLTNVDTLSNSALLVKLDLSNNQITDITSISGLEHLTTLNLSNNNIDDLDNITNMAELSTFEAKNQILSAKASNEGVVELPKIFSQVKEQENKCYTAEDFVLTNCTLNEGGKAITLTNKTMSGSIQIKGGAADGTILTIEDKVAPELELSYTTTLITNQDVTATIKASEPVKDVEGWTLSQDKMTLTKVFTENSEKEKVVVKDLNDNEAFIDVEVKNIDKIAPKIVVEYNPTGQTNKDVKVTIAGNEKLQQIEGWQLSSDLTKLTKTYTENSQKETIVVKDLAGNTVNAEVEVKNIDKQGPKASVTYSTTTMTNQDVVVTITAEEEMQKVSGWTLSQDKLSLTKTYSKNVEKETVTIKDLAGNSSTVDISIKNIDKVAPKPSVSYTSTNTSATVTIKVDEKIQQVEGWKISEDLTTLTKTYTKNTQEEVTIKDLAGNAVKVAIKVSNIPESSNNSQNQNQNQNQNSSQNQSEKAKADNSLSENGLPYTGINYIAGIAIVVAIIAVVYFKKLRNLKDIR